MLKRCCCAWQIWNKQHLRRRVEFKWASRNPGAGILSCRWRHRGGGVKPHFLFMRFHGLLLVVPELSVCSSVRACVCRCVCRCVCVWERATSNPPEAKHTRTYCTQSTPYRSTLGRKNKSMPASVWGVSVYGCTHTYMRLNDVHAGGLSRFGGG